MVICMSLILNEKGDEITNHKMCQMVAASGGHVYLITLILIDYYRLLSTV